MTADLRSIANQIFLKALAAIEVESIVRNALQFNKYKLIVDNREYDLNEFSRVIVIAIGKAAEPMARAAEEILGEKITDGIVATNALIGDAPKNFRVFVGGHPIPNQSSIDGAEAALRLLREANDEKTLVLFLVSGGGSAVFEKPIADEISLEDLQTINRVLVGCGAVIGEMNVVRKALSSVKGGRLAEAANRATQISLYISDVNHDDLATISSGLTLPGNFTLEDFDRIVEKYDLLDKFPEHISNIVLSTAFRRRLETLPPKGGTQNVETQNACHHLLLDNREALKIAKKIAEDDFNCVVEIAEDLVEGEIEEMTIEHLNRLQTLREHHPDKIVCLLSGGEVICPVRGNGQGGRNQEFVLRAAMKINPNESIAVLSAGTDGIDGHSPAAGAIADETTLLRAAALEISPIDYLQRSDSYNFFHQIGDAIIIGSTGNNVRDLRIFLAKNSK